MTSSGPAAAGLAVDEAAAEEVAAARVVAGNVAWPSVDALAEVVARLRVLPPIVRLEDCLQLREYLAEAARGDGYLVQGGDCAELFEEVSQHTSRRKAAQLAELADLVEGASGRPCVAVGRIGGQFAKPRSHRFEAASGSRVVPVYRGDAVNDRRATAEARTADPRRMLTAYRLAVEVRRHLDEEASISGRRVYTSHEALLLDYEHALLRRHGDHLYASSAHLVWVGERTRDAGGPHVALLARAGNPVSVKLGPGADGRHVMDLIAALDPARTPGRLTFIVRLGAGHVELVLPDLVEAAASAGALPLWICDPMHGNTERAADGRKIRNTAVIAAEIRAFVRVLRQMGAHPAGLHLEISPDDVTECVAGPPNGPAGPEPVPLPRYWSGCDPRLNPAQARDAVHCFLEEAAR
jgi:3-deoxy-7-phosphoheptulonate synthase